MHLFVDTKRKNFVRRKSTQKSRRWRCDVPRSSIGSHTRHPKCHHTINQITIAWQTELDRLLNHRWQEIRQSDFENWIGTDLAFEQNRRGQRQKKKGLPGGNVDVPILRQIAKGLEIGEGRFDGNIHRRRTARSGGTTGRHGNFLEGKVMRKEKKRPNESSMQASFVASHSARTYRSPRTYM